MDEDRIEGKEKVGKATGDRSTGRGGKADQAEGKVQQGAGKARDAVHGKD